jgi:hypothetical protein
MVAITALPSGKDSANPSNASKPKTIGATSTKPKTLKGLTRFIYFSVVKRKEPKNVNPITAVTINIPLITSLSYMA